MQPKFPSRRSVLAGGAAATVGASAASGVQAAIKSKSKAPFDISALPKLDDKQAGHIRHLQNLGARQPGDWTHMMGVKSASAGIESSGIYQTTAATYWALAVAQYNLLPGAPGVLRKTSDQFLAQMAMPALWGFWHEQSKSGPYWDNTLTESRTPWADPIVKENIQYSGRLSQMVGLHSVLYNDDKYNDPKHAFKFEWNTRYGNDGPQTFEYTQDKIAQTIYWQMVESGFMGVVCEPNSIFIICNNYAIHGLRYNDIRRGTNIADEVSRGFRTAWEQKGWRNEYGIFLTTYSIHQDQKHFQGENPQRNSYVGLQMNSWNPDLIKAMYHDDDRMLYAYRKGPDDTLTPWVGPVIGDVKKAIKSGQDPAKVVDYTKVNHSSYYELSHHIPFVAEMGDTEILNKLLNYVDRFQNPTWTNGGLHYPRNDQSCDTAGNTTYMDPWAGNGAIAMARLNVKDGLRNIYQRPWGKEHFALPNLTSVSDGVEVLRGAHAPEHSALVLTVRGREGKRSMGELVVANVDQKRPWTLYRDAEVVARGDGASITKTSLQGANLRDDKLTIATPIDVETTFVMSWA